jgi:cysteine desulfurase/selenocysteine lyase
MEHHSNIVPWENLSRIRGYQVKYAEVNNDGTLNYEAFEKAITDKTKIVCFSHVSNVTGVVNDVKRIAKVAHDHGALALADGAQSVPHLRVDVRDLGLDFLAFSGHKMLAPTGIGALYGKREVLEKMGPFHGGGEMIRDVTFNPAAGRCSMTWAGLPWRFEAGTPNVSGGIGLMEAVKYLKRVGIENVEKHEETLTAYAMKSLQELGNVEIYGPHDASEKCGIIPFGIRGLSSHDIALTLDAYGIMIRSGYHCAQPLHQLLKLKSSARASFYIYNTREEIDQLTEVLKEIGRP